MSTNPPQTFGRYTSEDFHNIMFGQPLLADQEPTPGAKEGFAGVDPETIKTSLDRMSDEEVGAFKAHAKHWRMTSFYDDLLNQKDPNEITWAMDRMSDETLGTFKDYAKTKKEQQAAQDPTLPSPPMMGPLGTVAATATQRREGMDPSDPGSMYSVPPFEREEFNEGVIGWTTHKITNLGMGLYNNFTALPAEFLTRTATVIGADLERLYARIGSNYLGREFDAERDKYAAQTVDTEKKKIMVLGEGLVNFPLELGASAYALVRDLPATSAEHLGLARIAAGLRANQFDLQALEAETGITPQTLGEMVSYDPSILAMVVAPFYPLLKQARVAARMRNSPRAGIVELLKPDSEIIGVQPDPITQAPILKHRLLSDHPWSDGTTLTKGAVVTADKLYREGYDVSILDRRGDPKQRADFLSRVKEQLDTKMKETGETALTDEQYRKFSNEYADVAREEIRAKNEAQVAEREAQFEAYKRRNPDLFVDEMTAPTKGSFAELERLMEERVLEAEAKRKGVPLEVLLDNARNHPTRKAAATERVRKEVETASIPREAYRDLIDELQVIHPEMLPDEVVRYFLEDKERAIQDVGAARALLNEDFSLPIDTIYNTEALNTRDRSHQAEVYRARDRIRARDPINLVEVTTPSQLRETLSATSGLRGTKPPTLVRRGDTPTITGRNKGGGYYKIMLPDGEVQTIRGRKNVEAFLESKGRKWDDVVWEGGTPKGVPKKTAPAPGEVVEVKGPTQEQTPQPPVEKPTPKPTADTLIGTETSTGKSISLSLDAALGDTLGIVEDPSNPVVKWSKYAASVSIDNISRKWAHLTSPRGEFLRQEFPGVHDLVVRVAGARNYATFLTILWRNKLLEIMTPDLATTVERLKVEGRQNTKNLTKAEQLLERGMANKRAARRLIKDEAKHNAWVLTQILIEDQRQATIARRTALLEKQRVANEAQKILKADYKVLAKNQGIDPNTVEYTRGLKKYLDQENEATGYTDILKWKDPGAPTVPPIEEWVQRMFDNSPETQAGFEYYRDRLLPIIDSMAETAGIKSKIYGPRGTYIKMMYTDKPTKKMFVRDTATRQPIQPGQRYSYRKARAGSAQERTMRPPHGRFVIEDLGELLEGTLADRLPAAAKMELLDMLTGIADEFAQSHVQPGDTLLLKSQQKGKQNLHPYGRKITFSRATIQRSLGRATYADEALGYRRGYKTHNEPIVIPTEMAEALEFLQNNKPPRKGLEFLSNIITGTALLVPAEATMHALGVMHALLQAPGIGLEASKANVLHLGKTWDRMSRWPFINVIGKPLAAIADMHALEGKSFLRDTKIVSQTAGMRSSYLGKAAINPEPISIFRDPIRKLHELPPFRQLREYVFGMPNFEEGPGAIGGLVPRLRGLETRARVVGLRALRHAKPELTDASRVHILNNAMGTYVGAIEPLWVKGAKWFDPFTRAGTGLTKTGFRALLGQDITGQFSAELAFYNLVNTAMMIVIVNAVLNDGKLPFSYTDENGERQPGIEQLKPGDIRIPYKDKDGKQMFMDWPFRLINNSIYRGINVPGFRTMMSDFFMGRRSKGDMFKAWMRGLSNGVLGRMGPHIRALMTLSTGKAPYLTTANRLMQTEIPNEQHPIKARLSATLGVAVPALHKFAGMNLPFGGEGLIPYEVPHLQREFGVKPATAIGRATMAFLKSIGMAPALRDEQQLLSSGGTLATLEKEELAQIAGSIWHENKHYPETERNEILLDAIENRVLPENRTHVLQTIMALAQNELQSDIKRYGQSEQIRQGVPIGLVR